LGKIERPSFSLNGLRRENEKYFENLLFLRTVKGSKTAFVFPKHGRLGIFRRHLVLCGGGDYLCGPDCLGKCQTMLIFEDFWY
jgi:hypothetical protein